ncbi:MAG: ATP-dependent metallopeptidase FtsH/Yme1/Tma family protein [Clostridia bacterium]
MGKKKNTRIDEKEKKKRNKKEQNKLYYGILIAVVVVLLIAIGVVYFITSNQKKDDVNLAYTDLIKEIDNQKVEKIEMTVGSTSIKVKLKDVEEEKKAIVPSTQAFIELVQQKVQEGNEIELIQNPQNIFVKIPQALLSILPTAMMVILIILIIQMQGLGDKGKVYDDEESKVKTRFDDVAGLDEEKEELIEIVDFLKKPKKFIEMGAKTPRGILLCGKPGTGKTLIAKAIAGEANVPFISMSGSDLLKCLLVLEPRVRKLFEKEENCPCIIY